jgi:hypothetical protein
MTDTLWQPIETAPKGEPGGYATGPYLLGVISRDSWTAHSIVRWHWHKNATTGAWKGSRGVWEPDFWMPLPPPPTEATND